jgi:hypothetical protein
MQVFAARTHQLIAKDIGILYTLEELNRLI